MKPLRKEICVIKEHSVWNRCYDINLVRRFIAHKDDSLVINNITNNRDIIKENINEISSNR